MVDHEVAHVYVRDPEDIDSTRNLLANLPGVADIHDEDAQHELGLDHPRAGELVLVARPGHWFAYPWWADKREAPDYAGHVDIHNKPGFDPCELFFGWPPGSVSQSTGRIRGTHGRTDEDRKACWASTLSLDGQPTTLIELASAVRSWLEEAL
jgi:hypothetical protein